MPNDANGDGVTPIINRAPPRVLVAFPNRAEEWLTAEERLRQMLGDRVACAHSSAGTARDISEAEILVSFSLALDLAAMAGKLNWIQAMGSGTEAIHVPPGRDVILTNAAGLNAAPVAEAAFGLILASARNLPQVGQNQAARRWSPMQSRLLRGSSIGIVGTGWISRAIAKRAAAFEMRVLGFTRSPRAVPDFSDVRAREALATSARELDYLVLATSLDDETRHIVDAALLSELKPGCLLVNLARGDLVDEQALLPILRAGRIGAALDVFAKEPLPSDSELWQLPNVIVTPHSAGHRAGYADELIDLFAENLAQYLSGRPDRMRNRIR